MPITNLNRTTVAKLELAADPAFALMLLEKLDALSSFNIGSTVRAGKSSLAIALRSASMQRGKKLRSFSRKFCLGLIRKP
jgi:hypothetical protein